MKQLAILFLFFFSIGKITAQCSAVPDAGPDIHFCQGDQQPSLQGSIAGEYWWKQWSPAAGLDNAAVLTPNVQNLTGYRKYTLQAAGWGPNLLSNGDFEQGNTGFFSYLTYTPGLFNGINQYAVDASSGSHFPDFVGCPDHTTGSGNMLVARFNQAGDHITKWDVPATVGKQYRFRFSRMNPVNGGVQDGKIEVYVNGNALGVFNIDGYPCQWLTTDWFTFISTYNVVTIQVFAYSCHGCNYKGAVCLDDFELQEDCLAEDEAEIFYHEPKHTFLTKTICSGDSYQVGDESFEFDGNYEVFIPTPEGCDSTVHLALHTVKLPLLINPADPAFSCITPSIQLTGPVGPGLPIGSSLTWTTVGGQIIGNPNASSIWAGKPGVYNLKINYSNNGLVCADSTSVTVTTAVDVPVPEAGPAKLIGCTSPNTVLSGSIPGGDPSFLISWSTPNGQIVSGGNTLAPTVGAAGMYIMKVTNPNNGCARSDTTLVTQSTDVPLANAGPGATLDCLVSTATLSGQAATGSNFEFTWTTSDGHFSGGQNTLTPTVDLPGHYFLNVLNKTNNCIGTSSVTILQDIAKPDAQISQPFTLNCYSPQAPIVGNSSSGFAPEWSTSGGHFVSGTNTFQPVVDEAGTYFLKITNPGNHCSTTVSVVVSKNINYPTVGIASPTKLTCSNPTATLFGNLLNGGPSPAIVWTTVGGNITDGQNTLNPTVDALGTYVMTVTNTENGCSASAQRVVSGDVTLPVFSIEQPARLNCFNQNVVLSATPGNFSYQWATANGQIVSGWNSPFAAVSAEGNYHLTVTSNLNGCTAASSVSVQKTEPPTVAIFSAQPPKCFGQNSGSASAGAAYGFGSYTFSWSSGETGNFAQNLAAGQANVTVTDADGCTATASIDLAAAEQVTATASSTDQTMANLNDGTATATASGGAGGITFLWPNGQNTETVTGLAPGSYTVTATDVNGCTATATAIVGAAACAISLSGNAVNATCNGSATGSITAQLANPNGQPSYFWSNGLTGSTVSGLAAGFYTVTAQDANGCTATQTFTVGQPGPISLSETHTNVQCPNDLTGTATVSANGGTPGFSFLWDNGQTGANLTAVGAGNFQVVATDANGCTKTLTVQIKSADLIKPVVVLKNRTFSIDVNGKATLVAADFNDGSTDNCGITKWSATPPFFDCSQLGTHDVVITATDGAGNFSTGIAQATIVDNIPPTLTCPPNKEAWSCQAAVAFPYPVALDNCLGNGGQFEFLDGLQSGSVFPVGVTVNKWRFTDASGNSSTCEFTITIFDKPTATAAEVQPKCSGGCDGALTANLSGGKGPFTYKWETGENTPGLTGICAGYHLVTITDGGGCNSQATLFLGEPAAIAISNPLTVNDIGNAGIGSITLSVGGGTPGYTFSWTKNGQPFSTNQNLTGLNAGEYVLKITDANGCVLTSQKFVVDNLVSSSEPDWAADMALSPNPTSGRAELVFSKIMGKEIRVDAFEAAGRLVGRMRFDGSQSRCPLDFSGLAAGVYQLKISVDGRVVVRQLVRN